MHRNSSDVSTKQERIAELAKQSSQMAFTSLAYLMDIDWLKEAYRRTRKDSAMGVDGMTADEYEQDLEGNLQCLFGISTLDDKVLQRAIVMLLQSIFEQDFLDCSYGFRPG